MSPCCSDAGPGGDMSTPTFEIADQFDRSEDLMAKQSLVAAGGRGVTVKVSGEPWFAGADTAIFFASLKLASVMGQVPWPVGASEAMRKSYSTAFPMSLLPSSSEGAVHFST